MKKLICNLRSGFLPIVVSLAVVLSMGSGLAAATSSDSQPAVDQEQQQAVLSQQVRHKLAMIPWYSVFDNLSFKVDGDKVTLMGQVRRPVIKNEADSTVKSIEGVKEVINKIEVLPPSPFDNQIRRKTYCAIYSFGPLQRYGLGVNPGIHIIVKNGDVTLDGVVNDQADKDAAYIRARSVPGVFAVTNNLRVVKSS
ncbi:MAG: BON domain-containing protein [Candidatus Acidiferrales bacterium]